MPAPDLAGAINSLTILSSASLAITQYFYNNLSGRFQTGQAGLTRHYDLGSHLFTEEMKQTYDNSRGIKISSVAWPLCVIFGILFSCALLKAVDFGYDIFVPADVPVVRLFIFEAMIIIFTCALGWVGVRLASISRTVRALETAVTEIGQNVTVAVATAKRFGADTTVRQAGN